MDNTVKLKLTLPIKALKERPRVGQTVAVKRGDYIDFKIVTNVVLEPNSIKLRMTDGETYDTSKCYYLTFDE